MDETTRLESPVTSIASQGETKRRRGYTLLLLGERVDQPISSQSLLPSLECRGEHHQGPKGY